MFEIIFMIIFLGSFIALGFVFMQGKGAFLIAGYNSMTKEDQAKYDVEGLCRFMGKSMFAFTGAMALIMLSQLLENNLLLIVGIVSMIVITIFMIVYTNTGSRFIK